MAQIFSISDLNTTVNHEPRLQDLLLAEKLGMKDVYAIRRIIDEHKDDLEKLGELISDVSRKKGRGRKAASYYLTKKQSLFICTKARTEKASEITIALVDVYDAYTSGKLISASQEEQATLIPSEQRTIQELMKQKHEQEGIAYPELYARFKNKFRVAKYDQLPREQFADAVFYVSTMQNKTKQPEALPNANLAELRILVTHQMEFLAPNSPKRRMWQKMRCLLDGSNAPMFVTQQSNQLALQV